MVALRSYNTLVLIPFHCSEECAYSHRSRVELKGKNVIEIYQGMTTCKRFNLNNLGLHFVLINSYNYLIHSHFIQCVFIIITITANK